MDVQYIGEKSAILNWYITKNTTKAERSHSNTVFAELISTKSLTSRLWNVALRSLSNRECGAMEVSDTLLGISLYEVLSFDGWMLTWYVVVGLKISMQ